MEHDDLFAVAVAQEMSQTDLDNAEIVRRMRALYGLSYVDAVSAVAAARVLERHGQDLTRDT